MMINALEDLARQAIAGDRDALDRLVRALQGDVYGLAVRMLWNREDAEDATQEILVRTVRRLAQFDFRSALKTWVYRIAVNYILDVKKSPIERMQLNFQRFADDLVDGLSSEGPTDSERSLLMPNKRDGRSKSIAAAVNPELRRSTSHVESPSRLTHGTIGSRDGL
jgi:RNA polymerase sigma factor (sigma-70 family)